MKELDLPNRIFQQNKQLDVHYSEHRRQSPYDKKSLQILQYIQNLLASMNLFEEHCMLIKQLGKNDPRGTL